MSRLSVASRRRTCARSAILLLLAVSLPSLASAAPLHVRAGGRAFADSVRQVGKGAKLVVDELGLEGESAAATLELKRIDVWRPDAIIEVDGQLVTPPATVYFRGTVAGDPASVAVLSVRESGEVQGLVQKGGRSWLVGKGRNQRGLRSTRADEGELAPFECGNDDEFSPSERLGVVGESPSLASLAMETEPDVGETTVIDTQRVASIAVETDYEFFAKFGNTTAALDYIGDLIGYADVTYSREVDTDMQVGYARLWTTGSSGDPWASVTCTDSNGDGKADQSPCGTSGLLGELRSYWNANMSSVNRTLVHMLSGKNLGGGIAYIGILCQNWSSSRGNTADYGLSASLGANFSWDGDQSHDPANLVWDIIVVQHEIGHNFNSPHAHDYCNLGGSSLPIDNCWSGCQSGATVQLPSCSSPTPHFTSGVGAGTIMSYCHQRTGGYKNIAMTFGEGHTCGTLPNREAARMAAHAASRASTYPSCFATPTCGNGVIDQGEQCDGLSLGGATCGSLGFSGGTLTCSPTCTLSTAKCSSCGNNRLDAGEVCDGTALGGATCSTEGCSGGTLGCNATCSGYTKASCTGCPVCDGDGTCEAGETCTSCPSDCASGTTSGAKCGNGICEAGNGEDCLSCPSDCNGVQKGKPRSRFCCGDGSGQNPLPCSNSQCTAGGRSCTTVKKTTSSYCCGDGVCQSGETCSLCSLDCRAPVETCGNAVDDNCNGVIDCSDPACADLAACLCLGSGDECISDGDCCSGTCQAHGKYARTCH